MIWLKKLCEFWLLAKYLVEVKHDVAKEQWENNASSYFGGTITAIMIACGLDTGGETPLACDNKLSLSAFQKKQFLCGWFEDSAWFGYLFTPPYEEEHYCTLLPCDILPKFSEGNPSFDLP